MILGDLGAEVIKIERPGTGDDTRQWGPPWAGGREGGESAYFLCANRNKRSVLADLKTRKGRALVGRLAGDADVLIENFAPDTLEKCDLGYERLAAANPGLVFCSITGYGSTGAEARRPGYDFTLQARAGWMAITGEPEGAPMKVGVAVVDVLAGQNAAIAILAALREREHSGRGQRVHVSLMDSAAAGLINVAQAALVTGREPVRYGNAHPTIVPYQAFDAADRPLVIAVGNDAQWRRLCGAVELEELADEVRFATNPRRVENRAEVARLLTERLRERTAAEWLARLDAAAVPCSLVQTVGELMEDPALRGRGGIWEMEIPSFGRIETVASPLRLARTPPAVRYPPPALGEHSAEVEREGWARPENDRPETKM